MRWKEVAVKGTAAKRLRGTSIDESAPKGGSCAARCAASSRACCSSCRNLLQSPPSRPAWASLPHENRQAPTNGAPDCLRSRRPPDVLTTLPVDTRCFRFPEGTGRSSRTPTTPDRATWTTSSPSHSTPNPRYGVSEGCGDYLDRWRGDGGRTSWCGMPAPIHTTMWRTKHPCPRERGERDRDRDRYRDRDRHRDTQTDTETHRQTDRQTDRGVKLS